LRAAYLASGLNAPAGRQDIAKGLRAQDEALRAIPTASEVVLWVGPELFCQAILIRLLVLLGDRPRVSLVDPGDNPVSPGCGLDARTPAQLQDLFARRRPVTAGDVAFARQAWAAFTAATAQPLVALLRTDAPLPHASAALTRHLGDLPDGASGLSTSETRILEELRRGPAQLGPLLRAVAAREPRPFLGDTALDEILGRLADGPAPLVTRDSAGLASITRRGGDVLHGFEVWFARRWHGGIEVTPDEDPD